MSPQRPFFAELFRVMNEMAFDYVVLHSWQTLPDEATHDVDMLIAAKEKARLQEALGRVETDTGWRFVQKLWYDVPWCFFFVAVSPDGTSSASLDFVSDPNGVGEYRIKDSAILANRVRSGLLWHLSTEAELAYKLAKRRVKGIFRDEDLGFTKDYLARSDAEILKMRMRELVPDKAAEEMLAVVAEGDIDAIRRYMASHSPAFMLFGRRWRIKPGVSWFLNTIRRIVHRVVHSTGAVVYLKDAEESPKLNFPAFVFRREKAIPAEILKWRARKAALSSATLLKVVGANDNGFDLGTGFIPFVSGNRVCQILAAMSRRYTNE